MDINFTNVTFRVEDKKLGYKKIIKGVTGQFKSGELTAIMGPSGAGKTSLLNILTGYQKTGVEGVIRCTNGLKTKEGARQYKKESCYILQDDHLMAFFTVEEIMYSTTKLKIDGLSHSEATYLIDNILNTLGLNKQKKTPCGNLSGGQRKRLSVALELIDDPPIMFLDEPTTGLDISSSNQCVAMLKYLASKGRTIICTIHQPSAPLYISFNQVYVMAQGKCVYQGPPLNTLPFLASLGFICPQYHNPADFLLEVTNCEYGDCIDKLAIAAKEPHWRDSIMSEETKTKKGAILTHKESTYCFPSVLCSRKTPPEWKIFWILLQKQIIFLYRDWTVSRLKLLLHLLVGIFLGVTFQNSGYDGSKTITNISFFLVSVVYLSYTSLMPAVLRFPSEMSIIRKEHFNRWYKLRTYYIAFLTADIPMQMLFTLAYTIGSYIISSQPLEFSRFFMVLLIQSMVAMTAAGLGLVYGTLCNPINGTFMAAITTALLFSVAGFLCLFPHMNRVMYFIANFSFMSFSMEGLLQAVYGNNRGPLICPEEKDYCMYTQPRELLQDVGMDKLPFWVDFGWLMFNLIIFRVVAFCTLKRKLNNV